jgi:two-component system nitrate/nitrite sensor histidine kinase NarX
VVSDLEKAEAAESSDEIGPEAVRWLAATRHSYRSFLAVPLVVEGQVDHCLACYYAEQQAFSDEEIGLALALADQAALAIENARLYEGAKELAAIEERQRLARDLHDAVSQTLFSASLIAETLPEMWQIHPDEVGELLQKLRQLSRGALAEMRTLLMELRPAALAEASLRELLRQLAQAASGREGIPVVVEADETCKLPGEVHLALYRIAQEALNNVVKHAEASQVEVSLRCIRAGSEAGRALKATLCIRDDGAGFDPRDASPERFGLGIMRERAAQVGAELAVTSEMGRGTEVRVTWTGAEEM